MIHRIEVILLNSKQPELTEHYSAFTIALNRFNQLAVQYGVTDSIFCEDANCYAGGIEHPVLICLESIIDNLNDYE